MRITTVRTALAVLSVGLFAFASAPQAMAKHADKEDQWSQDYWQYGGNSGYYGNWHNPSYPGSYYTPRGAWHRDARGRWHRDNGRHNGWYKNHGRMRNNRGRYYRNYRNSNPYYDNRDYNNRDYNYNNRDYHNRDYNRNNSRDRGRDRDHDGD